MTVLPSALSVNGEPYPIAAPLVDRPAHFVTASPYARTSIATAPSALRFRERVGARTGTAELLVFRLGNEHFGVDLQAVEETLESPELHNVPESTATVLGVFVHSDRFIPLYDTAAVLGMIVPTRLYPAALVMRAGGRRIGLAVEDVEDVVRIELSTVRDVPVGAFDDDLLLGLVVQNKVLIAVLDARALVSSCQTAAVPEAL